MATLPADRTKLALAQNNQVPNMVIASAKNINSIVEAYDTIDLLNQKVDTNYGTGAIGTNQLAVNSVTLTQMADSSVGTAELVAASVTLAKMAAASVGTSQIVDGSVTDAKIAPATITADKFVAGALNNDTQNGLLITALQADVVQRAINIKSAPYNAVGDDLTLNTLAIQAALDATVDGGTLVIPYGVFRSGALTVNHKIRIIIFGTLKYNFTGATGGMLIINSDNVTIEGGTFDAYGTVGAFDYKAYITTTKARTIISWCRFYNGMQGAEFASGSTFGKITNCYAETMVGSGILFLSSLDGEAIGNTVVSCGDGALSIFSSRRISVTSNQVYTSNQGITVDGGSRNITVTGNKVWGDVTSTLQSTGYSGIEVKNDSHYCLVANNVVTGVVIGIMLWRGELNNACSNNTAIGNQISDIATLKGGNPYGMYINGQLGCIVSNNTISRCPATYIYADSYSSGVEDLIISDNNFDLHGVQFGSIPYVAYNQIAISVTGLSSVTIVGNNINCAPEAMTAQLIYLNNVTNFLIEANNISLSSNDVFSVQGSAGGLIVGNLIKRQSSVGSIFNLSTTSRVEIKHNRQNGAVGGYFVIGNATPYVAEGNTFSSTFSDAMNGSAIVRLFNNENTSTGLNGGQMKFSSKDVFAYDGTAFIKLSRFVGVPASATATGNAGDWSADTSYFYACHASNTWKRVAIATW